MVIHGNGGAVPPPEQENPNTYSWCRDLPKRVLQKLVDELKTRGRSSYDRMYNENAFKIEKVSRLPTGSRPLSKTLEFTR